MRAAPILGLSNLSLHLGHVVSVGPVIEARSNPHYVINMAGGHACTVFEERTADSMNVPVPQMKRDDLIKSLSALADTPILILNGLALSLDHVVLVGGIFDDPFDPKYTVVLTSGLRHEIYEKRELSPNNDPTTQMKREELISAWKDSASRPRPN